MKRIVLAGAGHAHLVVLGSLAKNPLYGAAITLVSPRARQLYSGMLPGVLAGHYRAADASIDLPDLAARAQCDFIEDSLAGIEAASRSVTLEGGRRLPYDLLSLNVGSRVELSSPGAAQHAVPVKPFENLLRLGPVQHVAIAGGGAAGVELAMALRHRGVEVTDPAARLRSPARRRDRRRSAAARHGSSRAAGRCGGGGRRPGR